jgi:hypothetical protein
VTAALVPVASSNVEAVGYDAAARELHVRFKSGPTVYVYEGVAPEQHQALIAADSIGSHLHRHIKGRHGFRRIEPDAHA